MWFAEQQEDFNPFNDDESMDFAFGENTQDFMDRVNRNVNDSNVSGQVKMAEDGWADYADDGINTIDDKEEA